MLNKSFSNFDRSRFRSSADDTIIGETGGFELVGGRTGMVEVGIGGIPDTVGIPVIRFELEALCAVAFCLSIVQSNV